MIGSQRENFCLRILTDLRMLALYHLPYSVTMLPLTLIDFARRFSIDKEPHPLP